MNWINKDVLLEGGKLILRPLQHGHIDALVAAGQEKKIWEFLPISPEPGAMRAWYLDGLERKKRGDQYPFTAFDKEGNVIGTTRYGEIEQEHRKLEIGWTWYKPEIWGKGYNEECKHLLLSYAFDVLKAVRVQLKTSEKNYRSRRAIERLGCRFEGVYRNHVIRQGYTRNSAMFSMIPEEWETAKYALQKIVDEKYAGTYRYAPDAVEVDHRGYTITTNKHKMQVERIHQWLSTQSYWLPGVSFDSVKTTFDHSFCIGVFHEGLQIGYGRFVTDYVRFAYLADVYVEEAHRGKGLGKKMMEVLHSLDWVKGVCKLMLHTKDAHDLYIPLGYAPPPHPDRHLEKFQKQPWQ